jgi:hypothetical protein
MVCEKCGKSDFVSVDLANSKGTTIVLSVGKEIARESVGETTKKVSVCRDCGNVTIDGSDAENIN